MVCAIGNHKVYRVRHDTCRTGETLFAQPAIVRLLLLEIGLADDQVCSHSIVQGTNEPHYAISEDFRNVHVAANVQRDVPGMIEGVSGRRIPALVGFVGHKIRLTNDQVCRHVLGNRGGVPEHTMVLKINHVQVTALGNCQTLRREEAGSAG